MHKISHMYPSFFRTAHSIAVKEEAHTSHCNQALEPMVAKNDKKVATETLVKQRIIIFISHKAKSLTQ